MTDMKDKIKKALLLILASAIGILRGTKEGMVMIKPGDKNFAGPVPGARGHAWFRFYHAAGAVKDLLLVAWGAVLYCTLLAVHGGLKWTRLIPWLLLCGLAAWEGYELGYAHARFGVLVNPYLEHIVFFGAEGLRVASEIMHAVRIGLIGGVIVWIVMGRGK
jgi:hypothetical protein